MRILVVMSLMLVTYVNSAIADDGERLQDEEVKENFVGTTWYAEWETALRPGRVKIETDPSRVRSGNNSIRLHLEPGDCGKNRPVKPFSGFIGMTTCTPPMSELVGISPTGKQLDGTRYYALSVMLDQNLKEHQSSGGDISLFEWQSVGNQPNIGPCFNIMFDVYYQKLVVDQRCTTGWYVHSTEKTYLSGQMFGQWHEFVVGANWSNDKDKGFFRVLHNGQLVMDYKGPTLLRGVEKIQEAAFIHRYRPYPTPSTVWFDDIIRTWNVSAIKKRYNFEEALLTKM